MSTRRFLFAFAAPVAFVAAGAAACSSTEATTSSEGSVTDSEVTAYCDVARRADTRIGARLAGFDPDSVTPAELKQLFQVAVAETAETRDAAPAELVDELRMLNVRWSAQQQIFADAEYVLVDAPPDVMALVGEELEAFDTVAKFNAEQCSLDGEVEHEHEGEGESDHSHEEGENEHSH